MIKDVIIIFSIILSMIVVPGTIAITLTLYKRWKNEINKRKGAKMEKESRFKQEIIDLLKQYNVENAEEVYEAMHSKYRISDKIDYVALNKCTCGSKRAGVGYCGKYYFVRCTKCNKRTENYSRKYEARVAWNKLVGGNNE